MRVLARRGNFTLVEMKELPTQFDPEPARMHITFQNRQSLTQVVFAIPSGLMCVMTNVFFFTRNAGMAIAQIELWPKSESPHARRGTRECNRMKHMKDI